MRNIIITGVKRGIYEITLSTKAFGFSINTMKKNTGLIAIIEKIPDIWFASLSDVDTAPTPAKMLA